MPLGRLSQKQSYNFIEIRTKKLEEYIDAKE
jgi:hypothetical protein